MIAPMILVAAVAAATPQEWKLTFDPARVGQHLPTSRERLVVVGPDAASKPAAAALADAIRASGQAALVMDGVVLGEVANLEDKAIVKRAKTQPLTQVVIVRVFDRTAVVSAYDLAGKATFGFSGTAGQRLDAGPRASDGVGAGVSKPAAEKIAEINRGLENDYELKQLGVMVPMARTDSGETYYGAAYPYRGRSQNRLSWDGFFVATGRKDLAASYNGRVTTKTLMLVGGVAAPLLGFALGSAMGPFTPAYYGLFLGGAVTGLVLGWNGATMDPLPITVKEAEQLAEQHNDALRSGARATLPRRIEVAIALGPTGFSLQATF